MGLWVGSGHITKYGINLDLIKIIQFCLKIYDLLRHPTYGWVYGSMGGVSQMTNLIKLELIDKIRFCLKNYDLWRHPHLWVGSCQITKIK